MSSAASVLPAQAPHLDLSQVTVVFPWDHAPSSSPSPLGKATCIKPAAISPLVTSKRLMSQKELS